MLELEWELAEDQEESSGVQKDRSKVQDEKEKQIAELSEELAASSSRIAEQVESPNDAAHEELVAKMQELEAQLEKRTKAAEEAEAAIKELEDKLAQAKARAKSNSSDNSDSGEVALLQEEVHKLEQMVRDRTEQLNKMQWQQNMTERTEAANMDSDNKMLIVLNQQLTDARESNNRLVIQVRELEARLAETSSATLADDLTAIKGIGPKVAAQLVDLGIASFLQLAEIEDEDLADESHALHGFRKRIEKDGWIVQAREMAQG